MKKTLTMSLALAGIAGLALAQVTIETAPAGYIEKTKTGASAYLFVSNPFGSFKGAAPTLGDLDGSNLKETDYIKIVSANGKTLFTAKYFANSDPAGWYDENEGCSNAFPLARGTSIQFYGIGGGTLVMAGSIITDGRTLSLVKGHNFVGNASPVAKKLSDFTVSDDFNALGGDYAYVNNTKVVYLKSAIASRVGLPAGWYLQSAILGSNPGSAESKGDWNIPAGEGFRIYLSKSATVTVTLPGLNIQ